MENNDTNELSDDEREVVIADLFRSENIEVEFVGEYPMPTACGAV